MKTTPTGYSRKQLLADAGLRLQRRAAQLDSLENPREKLDLLAWGQHYLSRHFTRPPSGLHRWLNTQLTDLHHRRGTKLNVIGPRGAAKSTVVSLAYLLRAALENWEPYVWLVSDTRAQAWLHLDNVKAELTDNPDLQRDFPTAAGVGPVWRSGEIRLRNGVRIEALSTGQRIRGRRRGTHRPTLIVCDDLQNDGHIASPTQRDRTFTWFTGTLLPAGTKRTNVIHLATALHRDALALRLQTNPGWTSRTFRAIERWPDNMALWAEWEALYTAADHETAPAAAAAFFATHQTELERGAQLLWPEEEDLHTLMRLRVESGRTAFAREKQSSPLNPADCEWPEEYFSDAIWFTDWPPLQLRVIALDPSKGADAKRGDYSAFIKLGVGCDNRLYVEADLARRPTPQIVADGVAHCIAFRPDALGIEANQFQELLAAEFAAELERQHVVNLRPYSLDNRINKLVRIRRLGPLLAGRRIKFKTDSPGTFLLLRQLQDFPLADHDDGPDALEMAVRLASELLQQ